MIPRYKLLEDLSLDLWYQIKDRLHPADVENVLNTGPKIWNCIFKDDSWLNLALAFDRCSPVLVGYGLSRLRPGRKPKKLYVVLLARDYSGDLQYRESEFFGALQDGWKYDETEHEIYFPSGLTVNVNEVLRGSDEALLPMPRIFVNEKGGVYSEYCYYTEKAVKELSPLQILAHGIGPAYKGRAMRNGCRLLLWDREIQREYFIAPLDEKRRVKWMRRDMTQGSVEWLG
ncbi:hypothetical protein BJX96DRAFT_157079 [Aspergillus floccosus]